MTPKASVELAGPSRKHLPALDGLRGFAILLVLVSHLMLFNDKTGSRFGDSLAALRGLGWVGVDLFFVLSGFLITGILYDTLQDTHYFRSFYMRRFLRIFPLYYGFLFFLLILGHWMPIPWRGQQYVLFSYTQNIHIWFSFQQLQITPQVDLTHFWSLAVEEQFYIFWPLVIFLVRDRRKLIGISLALSLFALLLRIAMWSQGAAMLSIFSLTPCRMDTLLLGGCAALVIRGNSGWLPRRWMIPIAFLAAIIIASYTLWHLGSDMRASFFGATFGYLVIAVGCVALLLASIDTASIAHRLFSWQFLRTLGKYSYGIYVLHIFVAYLFGDLTRRVLGTSLRILLTPYLHSRPFAVLVEFCVNAAVVVFAAYLSYNLYEVHFLRLKRYFGYKKERPLPRAADPVAAE